MRRAHNVDEHSIADIYAVLEQASNPRLRRQLPPCWTVAGGTYWLTSTFAASTMNVLGSAGPFAKLAPSFDVNQANSRRSGGNSGGCNLMPSTGN